MTAKKPRKFAVVCVRKRCLIDKSFDSVDYKDWLYITNGWAYCSEFGVAYPGAVVDVNTRVHSHPYFERYHRSVDRAIQEAPYRNR